MDVGQVASYIVWLKSTYNHICWLIGGRRGDGKSQTLWAMHEELRDDHKIDSHFCNNPGNIRIADVLILDDFGKLFYARDFGKKENKQAMKALQSIRGAIPLLIVSTPEISRLDKDVRQYFGIEGRVLKHGWLWVSGVTVGPIVPRSLPPDDSKMRKKDFLEAFQAVSF